jgi:hypothetical protein
VLANYDDRFARIERRFGIPDVAGGYAGNGDGSGWRPIDLVVAAHRRAIWSTRMTTDRFRECLDALSWSQRGLAALLDVDERQVRRWATGQYNIPEPIAAWLETLARFHETHPAPVAPPPAPK